jgi:hypothetical protein
MPAGRADRTRLLAPGLAQPQSFQVPPSPTRESDRATMTPSLCRHLRVGYPQWQLELSDYGKHSGLDLELWRRPQYHLQVAPVTVKQFQ